MEDRYLHSMDSIPLKDIVKDEYRTYQIYTLMDRAIPYLQDGLKPGQRRILFTLWKNQSKGLMKVSSATGLVLTLHPHGPASVESAIVNMAQDYTFSNNYPLIDKKGYFGERMETSPAASRYIECKLSKLADYILFEDLNQVEMIPNYDEKVMEPAALLPKLPVMLMNGAEGIGTGFSSMIPSFHHKDLIASIKHMIQKGKPRKLSPYVHYYDQEIEVDAKGKHIYHIRIEEVGDKVFITELPKNYDASKVYKFLTKFIDANFIKDFVDSSVENKVYIEILFKKGQRPTIKEIRETMKCSSSLVPNYTLISERGVKIFESAEQIIDHFTRQRLNVVKRRYELLCDEFEERIRKNNEIVRFIKEQHYEVATTSANRKSFVKYLNDSEFTFSDYLADMPIYRMTKEEVSKRKLMVKDDKVKLKEYKRISKSWALIKEKLIEELDEVKLKMDEWLKLKDKEKEKRLKDIEKKEKKQMAKMDKLKAKPKRKK